MTENKTSPPTIAALGYADEPRIGRHAFFLLDCCTRYFKRTLPGDAAEALVGPGSRFTSPASVYRSLLYRRNATKFLPVSVGVPDATLADLPATPPSKDTDVFFSGDCGHSHGSPARPAPARRAA